MMTREEYKDLMHRLWTALDGHEVQADSTRDDELADMLRGVLDEADLTSSKTRSAIVRPTGTGDEALILTPTGDGFTATAGHLAGNGEPVRADPLERAREATRRLAAIQF